MHHSVVQRRLRCIKARLDGVYAALARPSLQAIGDCQSIEALPCAGDRWPRGTGAARILFTEVVTIGTGDRQIDALIHARPIPYHHGLSAMILERMLAAGPGVRDVLDEIGYKSPATARVRTRELATERSTPREIRAHVPRELCSRGAAGTPWACD
jgi:hypothetical protein